MLSYAYRDTEYNRNTYPSSLHYHDYFELVIFEEGNIEYICESCVYRPSYADVILIAPGKFHMSAINDQKTRYKRHVFYLYSAAFDAIGQGCLLSFLQREKADFTFSFSSHAEKQELLFLLGNLRQALELSDAPLESALGLSYIIQIFYFLNKKMSQCSNATTVLPENILTLQKYIDSHFAQISSVAQIAAHFFYSREYVSRLFKKHFDTTIADYILKRRVAESQKLIVNGVPIIDAAYRVGFGSLSAFIRAFRTVTGMTPSAYRKWKKSVPVSVALR